MSERPIQTLPKPSIHDYEWIWPGKYGWIDFICAGCGGRIIADALDPRCPKCDRESTNHEGSES